MTDEDRLVEKARAGDRAAMEALLSPWSKPLYGYIYRMVTSREDAEDLLQEALVRAIEQIPRFRGEARFKSWLFGIATNVSLDHLRDGRGSIQASVHRASSRRAGRCSCRLLSFPGRIHRRLPRAGEKLSRAERHDEMTEMAPALPHARTFRDKMRRRSEFAGRSRCVDRNSNPVIGT
jgi:RNA polymerase sigma factor (sigma-70 family)